MFLLDSTIGKSILASPSSYKGPNRAASAKDKFAEAQEKYTKVGNWTAGIIGAGVGVGAATYGLSFPAKTLRVLGDLSGSVAGLASPAFLVANEVIDYKVLKGGESNELFEHLREGFYRVASLGFAPYIIEPYVNPEKVDKSVFHKFGAVAALPNAFFSLYTWGMGNAKGLIAWWLKSQERLGMNKHKGDKEYLEKAKENIKGFEEIYSSAKRLAVIGSITNPVMANVRQCADTLALISGEMSSGEFFQRPFLGLSRLVSFGTAVPEFFAKNIDAVVRLVKEKENLKLVMPKALHSGIEKLAKKVEPSLLKPVGEKSALRDIRHAAEVVFHTVSPLSMFALFLPLLDKEHIDEDAQAQGGLQAGLDKWIGRAGMSWTVAFDGLYTFFARLPQAVFQTAYFGRKFVGRYMKNESEEEIQNSLLKMKENIINSGLVKGISDFARNKIEYLVPDFYTADHPHGFKTYEQIQAEFGLAQAKETEDYEKLKNEVEEISKDRKSPEEKLLKIIFEDPALAKKVTGLVEDLIEKNALIHVENDATQGKWNLTDKEKENIKNIMRQKLFKELGICFDENNQLTKAVEEQRQTDLPFVGANFLATWVFKLFDFRSRLESIDYRSSHHNMTTAYVNDEVNISFEDELYPVIGECVNGGLRSTVNRFFKIARGDFSLAA